MSKFTKEHEWVTIKDGMAIVGISDFAQKELGDIVSIELPKVGSVFRQMQTIAIIDSVKTSSDIYAPVSGEIVEINEQLVEKPEIINQSPYDLGWIVKIKPSNMKEFDALMTKEQYDRHVGEMR
ncbi:MAG: glycine cleavage system protein GcvH [Nitrososphaera sp.]